MCSRAQSGPNSLAIACSTLMAASRMLNTGSCMLFRQQTVIGVPHHRAAQQGPGQQRVNKHQLQEHVQLQLHWCLPAACPTSHHVSPHLQPQHALLAQLLLKQLCSQLHNTMRDNKWGTRRRGHERLGLQCRIQAGRPSASKEPAGGTSSRESGSC